MIRRVVLPLPDRLRPSIVALLGLVAVLLLLPSVAPAGPEPNCQPAANACLGNIGIIGEGACIGNFSCQANSGEIRKRACQGTTGACADNNGIIGENACQGSTACFGNSGVIGKAACIDSGACFNNDQLLGDGACVGLIACGLAKATTARSARAPVRARLLPRQ